MNKGRVPNTRRRSDDPHGFPKRIDTTRFKEVGRINRPSQATSWEDYDDRIALLDEIYHHHGPDLLIAFRDGHADMNELMRFKRLRRLDTGLGTLKLQRPLLEALDEIVPVIARKEKTRDGYMSLLVKLVSLATPRLTAASTVRDLQRVNWTETLKAWEATGVSGQTWNNMRIALGSFLGTLIDPAAKKKLRPIAERDRIMDLVPTAQTAPGRTPDASIAQLVAIAAAMPRKTGANVISLLVTGLRVKEFHKLDPETDLLPHQQALRIGRIEATEGTTPFTLSTKNTSSAGLRYVPEGFWPIVAWSAHNKPAYITLRRHWCQACHEVGLGVVTRTDGIKQEDGELRYPTTRWPQEFTYQGLRLHDLRHFYTQYVRDGGVPLSELRHALGHASEESSAGYAARIGKAPETAADKARRAKRLAADVAGRQFADLLSIEALWPVEEEEDD